MPFTGQIAHLVGSGQALVALANNPADWAGKGTEPVHRASRALFGHPGLGQQTRLVASPDAAAGVATLSVRTGMIGWISADTPDTPAPSSADRGLSPLPGWAARLAADVRRYRQVEQQLPEPITLRPPAVLVLLTDGATGPTLLLTERALDLRDYPGRLVFPGGVSDPQDTGPVSTALREAGEEVGLDPGSVQILGVLPALAEPEGKFLVTAVLAWSDRPAYARPVNLAEVTSVHDVPLRQLAARFGAVDPARERDGAHDARSADLSALGPITATVIDLLLALLTGPTQPGGPDNH